LISNTKNNLFTDASYPVIEEHRQYIIDFFNDTIKNSNLLNKQNAAIVAFSIFLGIGAGAFVSLIVT
jgi:hypothetical protein